MNIVIAKIDFDSENYQRAVDLRSEVLRAPLGLKFSKDDLDRDRNDVHIGAFLNSELIGCLILTRASSEKIRVRQVAVRETLRGQNIGRKLMEFSEELAAREGVKLVELNARVVVVPFYEKLGYEIVGPETISVGLPHRLMQKKITHL